MPAPQHNSTENRCAVLVGTGGIGAGVFFAMDGAETLGREESRSGRFLDQRDYCKLHIVADAVRRLSRPEFHIYPIGRVGNDPDGRRLLEEMRTVGLCLDHVKSVHASPTLRSVSFVYPDGSGGNLTTRESASHTLIEKDIQAAEPLFTTFRGRGFAVALPEVPLPARQALLFLGRQYDFFTAASFLSAEMPFVRASGILKDVDLLAANADEAASLAEVSRALPPTQTVEALVRAMEEKFPHLRLCVTAGRHGSWTWEAGTLCHIAPCDVVVRNAAGAGDTHLAGLLAGLAAGLSFAEAHEIAALAGAYAVTSEHAIHPTLDRKALLFLATQTKRFLSGPISDFLLRETP
jgi:ribokinase